MTNLFVSQLAAYAALKFMPKWTESMPISGASFWDDHRTQHTVALFRYMGWHQKRFWNYRQLRHSLVVHPGSRRLAKHLVCLVSKFWSWGNTSTKKATNVLHYMEKPSWNRSILVVFLHQNCLSLNIHRHNCVSIIMWRTHRSRWARFTRYVGYLRTKLSGFRPTSCGGPPGLTASTLLRRKY